MKDVFNSHYLQYFSLKMYQNINNIYWKVCFYLVVIILTVIPSILAILHAPIDVDSGYYISVIRRIIDGYTPYKDIKVGYPPIFFYFTVTIIKIFHIPNKYEYYLLIHFLFQYLNAFILYRITHFIVKSHLLSVLVAFLYLTCSHWNNGASFLLETPTLLWGLISMYIILIFKENVGNFIFTGIACSFAFLTKQYGIVFLVLVLLFPTQKFPKIKQIVFIIIGFFLPLIVFYMIFGNLFLSMLFGEGYGKGSNGYGIRNFKMIMQSVVYFYKWLFPCIGISYFYLPHILLSKNRNLILILLLGVHLFFLQFFFAPWSHYYLLIIPFASLLSVLLLEVQYKYKWVYYVFFGLTLCISIYKTYNNRVRKIYINASYLKEEQYKDANSILSIIPKNKSMYISSIGYQPLYFTTNRLPPNLKNISYSFPPALLIYQHFKQLNAADFVVRAKVEEYNFFPNCEKEIQILANRDTINLKNLIIYIK